MSEYTWLGEGVFTVAGLLSDDECRAQIASSESHGYADAPINTRTGTVLRKDIRNNDRVIVDDADCAAKLYQRARDFVPVHHRSRQVVGFNERFRYYRYRPGQQFDWHRDGYFERQNGERSLITVLVYLNGDFTGGETTFDEPWLQAVGRLQVVPQAGLALFFDHTLLHKGEPVEEGCKYVLRTDVMYSAL